MKLFRDSSYPTVAVYCIMATTAILTPLIQSDALPHSKEINDVTTDNIKRNNNKNVITSTPPSQQWPFNFAHHHRVKGAVQSHPPFYTYGNGVTEKDNNKNTMKSSLSPPPFNVAHHRRVKRTTKAPTRFYNYGIVPYSFSSEVSRFQKNIVERVINYYQDFTCIRFYPRISEDGQWAKDLYHLDHDRHIEFVEEDRCSGGGVGNRGLATTVSCCDRDVCIRQIGHALGLLDELQNPDAQGFVRINYKNIHRQSEKTRYLISPKNEIVQGYPFDISSPMFGPYGDDVTILIRDIRLVKREFYMFKEISDNHRCPQNNCSYFNKNCVNDGYVTVLPTECACRCPEGLNPISGCATVLSNDRPDEKCGGVYELNAQNPSVNFQKFAHQHVRCDWLMNAPEGDIIVLDFHQFYMPKRFRECADEISIRHSRIGQGDRRFCGTHAPRLMTSYFNRMMITFSRSRRPTGSFFNVTARLVSAHSLCYASSDKGLTYRGTVNFTRGYTPCANWHEAVDCPHNPYNLEDSSAGLDGNYCRNPGAGIKPWCYVDTRTCARQYCDVCHVDSPFDKDPASMCRAMKNGTTNLCIHGTHRRKLGCAKTCRQEVLPTQPSVSTVTCSRHPAMSDSVQIDKLNQDRFHVGDFVTFKCSSPENEIYKTELKKFCLSNGGWSSGNSACLPCHFEKGFVLNGEFCYRIEEERRTANRHHRVCVSMGGRLADVRSLEEQEFVTELGVQRGASNLYIGANDMYRETMFRFRDYTPVTWAPWANTDTNGRRKDCVLTSIDNTWYVDACNVLERAVCKGPKLRQRRRIGQNYCVDSRDDCQNLLEKDSRMCERSGGSFAYTFCTLTCGRCLWPNYRILF